MTQNNMRLELITQEKVLKQLPLYILFITYVKNNTLLARITCQHKYTNQMFIHMIKYLILLFAIFFINSSPMTLKLKHHQSPQTLQTVRLAYINRINQWWPPESIAAGIGVPGYANNTLYNYFVFAFWTYAYGPLDVACIWADPLKYFGTESPFGKTKPQIQKTLKQKYNNAGIKIMISAFGSTEFPTSSKVDPIDCALKLGNFVLQNNLDGVDIDWQDNAAMQQGTGQKWLIMFHNKLRTILPKHIITHAPQGPYFKEEFYKNGAYVKIHQQIGSTIDFYNVQFYNQQLTTYDTYQKLFVQSQGIFTGTSVAEIVKRGVPQNKIVVGKPVLKTDATNTGWMDLSILGNAFVKANKQLNWCTGVMFWQYASDLNGQGVQNAMGELIKQCTK